MIGRTLAHFEVLSKLGEGGMGVVYKARDTHLDRFVALKVLPPDKVADTERKRRFIQEAKSASALNHPNIIHIYDIDESDGVLFIAMEFVDGKSLDGIIAKGTLRQNDALKYAIQAADALAKAHSAGIVHRDLKPSNIMITNDGLVKVVDFGLAKLAGARENAPESDVLETLTRDSPHTEEGLAVGTAAYMSPEQAEGREVDARSDIFSFGVVLYEMVTGKRAFQRGSRAATLSAVLREDAPPVSATPESSPAEWDRLIIRCLRKDPDRRFQSIADLRVSLMELREESESSRTTTRAAVRASAKGSKKLWMIAAIAGVIAAATMFAVWMLTHKPPAPATAVAWKPLPLTSLPGQETYPSFSPDASQVAFNWDGEDGTRRLYVKLVGPGRPLRLTEGTARGAAWSPDGRFIAFYRELQPGHAAVLIVPALGGPERKIAEFDFQPWLLLSPCWYPDSKSLVISARVAGAENNSLMRVFIDSSEMVRLTEPPPAMTHGDDSPSIADDGHAMAFQRAAVNASGQVHVLALVDGKPSGTPRKLDTGTTPIMFTAWAPELRDLILSSGARGSLFRIPADGSGPIANLGLRDTGTLSVSARGHRLAYSERRIDVNLWEATLDPANPAAPVKGPFRRVSTPVGRKVNPQYSPDGKRIAYSSSRTGDQEIWMSDADGSNSGTITSLGAPVAGSPRWSPDAQTIAFDCNVRGAYDIYLVNPDGGKARALTHEGTNFAPAWSPDASRIYFSSNRSGRLEIWSMKPDGTDPQQITRGGGISPLFSADGQTIYFSRGEGSHTKLMKVPAIGGKEEVLADDLYRYSFAPAARGIYYLSSSTTKVSVHYIDFTTGKNNEVLSVDNEQELGLAVSRDGRRILFAKVDQADTDLMLVENFR